MTLTPQRVDPQTIEVVARRLKRGIDADEDAFDVFNDCQDHVVATARATVERFVLEALARALEPLEDRPLAELLGKVSDLFALSVIEGDRAWFQEHGRRRQLWLVQSKS